ncbi:uncharacterized protein EI90DRAFT_2971042 [Cantharellus anzutake]|uniref:uncharacterized protein n=1 Tax=Cantharellus anzutake TaxID=1750568 RepID=UPI0019061D3A|nr:uncharacterized protein EI90DRAFT_2971042 [Cantharellus anzutake]KAF8333571.1 hypothetical protein EI90DRAFT_2971042 [Cantharellus anzutake]
MSLRPSPSPSPAPSGTPTNLKPINTRASLQPSGISRGVSGQQQNPISPRPPGINTGHGRPTSELLSSNNAFQTPNVTEAIDQWFENLQNYETTLEEMAAASLDANFKEELSAIEQWFRVLSEAERTAALYSLLQHSTQMQIRFFVTVLQQMARSDPMTALLSPAIGASMQSQMEAKLASMGLKSPGLPASPSTRTFGSSLNRQSIAGDSSNFLSPDSANVNPGPGGSGEAAATLAHQRAKLKANAAHRISAPGTLISERGGTVWTSSQLGQVAERSPSPNNEATLSLSPPVPSSARPKSTDFTGVANSFRPQRMNAVQAESNYEDQLSPMVGGNWASMVNTPLNPMFGDNQSTAPNGNNLDAAAVKLANWNMSNNANGRVVLDDARKFRRPSAVKPENPDAKNALYGDDGEPINSTPMNSRGVLPKNVSLTNSAVAGGLLPGGQNWAANPQRSPALSAVSGRFNSNEQEAMANLSFAALGAGGPLSANGMGMGMNGLPFNMFNGMNGMPNLSPMNGLVGGMEGLTLNPLQQAQILAAQLAASGFHPNAFGVGGLQQQSGRRQGGRSPGRSSANGRTDGAGKEGKDDEINPELLTDVPAWLRSLRLHKYTPNFEGMTWKEMVMLDESELEAKGVAALGARRKLLKTFDAVKVKMGMQEAPATPSSS